MERAFENDNVFKNVVQEISRECSARCLTAEEAFVRHVTKLFALDIDMGITSDGVVKRDTLELFVNHVVDKLAVPENESPQMATLKIQLYGKERCSTVEKSLHVHKEALRNYLSPLSKEIIEETFQETEDSKQFLNKFRRKIAVYVLLASQMGHPSHIDVFNEGLAALNSVVSKEDLNTFFNSNSEYRAQYIDELTHIVSGIRLLNKYAKRNAGVGIIDIQSELETALAKSITIVNNALLEVQEVINVHTSAVMYSTEIDYRRLLVNFKVEPNVLQLSDIEDTRDRLILQRQYEILLTKLKERIEDISEQANNSQLKFNDDMQIIDEVVGKRQSLRASSVFPLFHDLATTWFTLQDYLYLLLESDKSAADLKTFAISLVAREHILQKMSRGNPVLTAEDRAKFILSNKLDLTNFKCKLLKYEEERQKEGFKLKFDGYCIWYLVHCRGFLVPSIPQLGLLQHRSELYAFSTIEAMQAFGRTPDRYLYSALEVVRGQPELVGFFDIEDLILNMSDHALWLCQELHPKPDHKDVRDVQIQTVTHLHEEKIDRNYKWNVWDMRREALQMANLTQSTSKSMQTMRTYHKLGVSTQTALPKNQSIQTMRDNYTNTAMPLNYKIGLRGQKGSIKPMVECIQPVKDDFYTCTAYNTLLFDTPFPQDPVPKCADDNNNKSCDKKCRKK